MTRAAVQHVASSRRNMFTRVQNGLNHAAPVIKNLAAFSTRNATGAAMPQVGVVGGGISGLVCATHLARQGYQVQVFDMGRHNPGGRMSTRRTVWRDMQFDHGCQLFTARDEKVLALIAEWEDNRVLGRWQGALGLYDAATGAFTQNPQSNSSRFFGHLGSEAVYVGVPTMDAVASMLKNQLGTVRLGVKVQKAGLSPDGKWLLEGDIMQKAASSTQRGGNPPHTPWNLGVFDGLVFADAMVARPGTPGHITITDTDLSPLMARIQSVTSAPLFSLMLAFDSASPLLQFEAASIYNSPEIQWIALNTSKPGRERPDNLQCWVAITTQEFAQQLMGDRAPGAPLPPQTPEYMATLAPKIWQALLTALQPALRGAALPEPAFMQAQRWGAALPLNPLGEACLSDERRVVACGDFCLGGGVENAMLSGLAAAKKMHAMLA